MKRFESYYDSLVYADLVSNQIERQPAAEPVEIYLIHDHKTGLVKIGRTNNFWRRFNELAKIYPDIDVLAKWKDHPKREFELHCRYANCRVEGEWFNLSRLDLVEIFRQQADLGNRVHFDPNTGGFDE
jgi:hypothetical protein